MTKHNWSVTSVALIVGFGVAVALGILWPMKDDNPPLLFFWLLLMLTYGAIVSFHPEFNGLKTRSKWLIGGGWLLVTMGLTSTQISARRAETAIHVRYDGVLLERTDSVRIGAGANNADVQLPLGSNAFTYWSLRIRRSGKRWIIDRNVNVDQVRVSSDRGRFSLFGSRKRDWDLSGSAILRNDGDYSVVADSRGQALDTLRRVRFNGKTLITATSGATYMLEPVNAARSERYRRKLSQGSAISSLDGRGRVSAPYERFVRIRQTNSGFISRVLGSDVIVLSSATPFHLAGPFVENKVLSFDDSSLVEVRQAESMWRFRVTNWRRSPSSGEGTAILFDRNPRAMDTPLPAGHNCTVGSACAAISLRALPSPISYMTFGDAGFSADRFGLLGRLKEISGGFLLTSAKETIAVKSTAYKPTAIPVEPLDSSGRVTNARTDRWLLLSARTGLARGRSTLIEIAIGLGLLLLSFYRTVARMRFRIQSVSRSQERWISLGITALLALLIARTIVGARVALYSPFLERAIETAVGIWIAIALVSLGLLLWPQWAAPLLSRARTILLARSRVQGIVHAVRDTGASIRGSQDYDPLSIGTWVTGVGALTLVSANGVLNGIASAFLILFTWFSVAWVIAFASKPFRVFANVSQVIDSVSPPLLSHQRILGRTTTLSPEKLLLLLCFVSAMAIGFRGISVIIAGAMIVSSLVIIATRKAPNCAPIALGGSAFIAVLTAAAQRSENRSTAAFILVLLITLASVRFGRVVASSGNPEPWLAWLGPLAPVLLLFPLALIDMGLFLVMALPVGFAAGLAAGRRILQGFRAILHVGVALLLLYLIIDKVLMPPVEQVRRAETHSDMSAAFERSSRVFGLSLPSKFRLPFERAAARSIATYDQELAERLLVAAGPGEARDLLMPSIEQIWGAKAYARSGLKGVGTGRAIIGDRGVAAAVSYAENAFSVYILAEHGAYGGLLVLLSYMVLAIAIGGLATSSANNEGSSLRASRALFIVSGLIVVIPAAYVALSNIGKLPITGQNMPFLGLNAWSDVAICAGVIGILITGAIRNTEDAA